MVVADFTYVRVASGCFAYTAFAIDAFANRILMACEHDDVVQVLGPGMLADGWRPDRLRRKPKPRRRP